MNERFISLNELTIPIFWVDASGRVTWCNKSARDTFDFLRSAPLWNTICQTLPEGYIYHIHDEANTSEGGFLVECLPDKNLHLINKIRDLQEQNTQLQLIFDEAIDEVYVTDGNGITIRVNKATERLYGIKCEDLIGRSVFDLERDGVFYPSVIAMAIHRRTQVTMLQSVKNGKRLIATANPVFDDNGQIVLVISTAKDVSEFPLSEQSQPTSNANQPTFQEVTSTHMVSVSPAMTSVLKLADKVARTEASVLLLGETGVGKNMLAKRIHDLSTRKNGPFIDVNCAAIPETLVESELFGYEGGAFTGALKGGKPGKVELANGGTLFLNEIGELPLHLQGKLLDFIQQRTLSRIGSTKSIPVNTRIIAATNRDLAQMVAEGRFRADLYHRLNVIPIEIPPLRHRPQDIAKLADAFLARLRVRYPHLQKRLAPQTYLILATYDWPGNVRELENVMERLVVTVDDEIILPHHLPKEMLRCVEDGRSGDAGDRPQAADADKAAARVTSPLRLLEHLERSIYEEALRTCKSTYEIASVLQVSQATVVRKLKQYGLRAAQRHRDKKAAELIGERTS